MSYKVNNSLYVKYITSILVKASMINMQQILLKSNNKIFFNGIKII